MLAPPTNSPVGNFETPQRTEEHWRWIDSAVGLGALAVAACFEKLSVMVSYVLPRSDHRE